MTRNPAIRNLLTSSGTLAVDAAPPVAATAADRPVSIDDIVVKTAVCLGTIVAAAVLTAALGLQVLALPALLVGLAVGVFQVLRPRPNAPLTLLYCTAQGVVLGAMTSALDEVYPGIGTQAVIGTCAVFVAMLLVYKARIIRISTKLARWLVGTTLGLALLLLANFLAAAAFQIDLGLRDGGVVAIVVSLACIAAASFSFLLSFEAADRLIRAGAPVRWAWYIAFGLAMTLVWLYLEILWLLSYFK